MSLPDVVRRCQSCGTRFLITGYERSLDSGAPLPVQCPGCLALERLTRYRQGTVHWYNRQKGYGFIRDLEGQRIFVHCSALVEHKHLRRGQKVMFGLEQGDKGPQAVRVQRTD